MAKKQAKKTKENQDVIKPTRTAKVKQNVKKRKNEMNENVSKMKDRLDEFLKKNEKLIRKVGVMEQVVGNPNVIKENFMTINREDEKEVEKIMKEIDASAKWMQDYEEKLDVVTNGEMFVDSLD